MSDDSPPTWSVRLLAINRKEQEQQSEKKEKMHEEEKNAKRKVIALFSLRTSTFFLIRIFHYSILCDLSQVNVRTRLEGYHCSFCFRLYRVVRFNRHSARPEIYPASLFDGWFTNTLELMPQGMVATRSEPVTLPYEKS